MAHGRPWYKRNAADFIIGTVGMDLETRGAYSLIIDMLNDRDRPLTDEARWIAGFLGVSVRRWGIIRRTLLADPTKLYLDDDGCLTNPRFERERAERAEEREVKVKSGRAGGLKSAAARKSGQEELDLERPGTGLAPVRARTEEKLSSIYPADKREINGAKTKDKVEIIGEDRQSSAISGQASAQATRAREETREQITHPNPSESYAARAQNSDGSGRDENFPSGLSDNPEANGDSGDPGAKAAPAPTPDQPDGRLRNADLIGLFNAVCDASGYATSAPASIDRSLKQIEAWRNDGIDFETIVLPIIRRMTAEASEPTRVISRFDKAIRHEHARAKAAGTDRGKYRPVESPVLDRPDESEVFRPLREALLKQLGIEAYCTFVNPVRFVEVTDGPPRSKPMRVVDPRPPTVGLMASDRGQHVRRFAKQIGFTQVW
jgi:uncharacterized protein YdaU (DUF1376 family)